MEISNKGLVIMLGAVIVFSVIGTFMNINRIGNLSSITGYGSSGYVNITVQAYTSINVTSTSCDFGTGYITSPFTFAVLESNGTLRNWTGSGTSTTIQVRNDGNKNVQLNLTATKNTTDFYGTNCTASNPACEYRFWSTENETNACVGGTLVPFNGTSLNKSNQSVCTNMSFNDASDLINVWCHIVISENVPPGTFSDVWTFWIVQL